MSARVRCTRRRGVVPVGGSLLAAVLTAALLAGGAVTRPATADELSDARAEAAALAVRLDRLHARLELAQERRAEAEAALTGAIGVEMAGARSVDFVARARADRDASVERTVRALYMAGGTPALYASVLDGSDLADVAVRARMVSQVLRDQVAQVHDAEALVARAQRMQRVRERGTATRIVLAGQAARAEDRAAALEARIAQARADADARVATLVEEERARIEAERQAAAEAALAAAGQVPWGQQVAVPDDQYAAVDAARAAAEADPATEWALGALTDARQWLGTPYSAGGGGPDGPGTGWCSSSAPDDGRGDSGACLATSTVGFDCSSFVQRVYAAGGLALPRTSREQWWAGRRIPMSQLRPGDLLFWAYNTGNPSSIHHVALYLGDGLMVHSPHTGDHVRVAAVYTSGLIGAVRPG